MSRAKRIVLVALMVGLMAQGAGADEGVSQGSWFDSVVQAIVSLFEDSEVGSQSVEDGVGVVPPGSSSTVVGEEPELGPIHDPFG